MLVGVALVSFPDLSSPALELVIRVQILYPHYRAKFPTLQDGLSLLKGFDLPHNNEIKACWQGEALLQHKSLHGGHNLSVGKGIVH